MPHDHSHHGHDHSHGHSHAPRVTSGNERKMLLAFAITFGFMLVEAVGGLIAGSLALVADAGHMLTDAAALFLAYAAFRVGKRAADARRTFGYLRLEVVAGLLNALALFAIVVWIGVEAVDRFRTPSPVLAGPMLAVAVVGLLVNLFVFRILSSGDSEHVNVKGAILHVLGDLLGSVGAIIAAVVIYFTGWTPIDPILSVVVSLLILRSAWSLLRKSLHILLEGAPDDALPDSITQHLMQTVPRLTAVSHVHVWSITSGRVLATLDVRPATDSDARCVAEAVETELHSKFGIDHATVAIDWPDRGPAPCPLGPTARNATAHRHDGSRQHGTVIP